MLRISTAKAAVICIVIAMVIVCELFNTAIEVLTDTLIDIRHPKVKVVKDISASAVFLSAILSLVVAYFIFFHKVSVSLESIILRLRDTPIHIAAISVGLTFIAVFVIKSLFKRGTLFSGGMPSGHSAIAISFTTAVALWSDNTTITILFLAVSLLVIQSRYEGKLHTLIELIAGAFLGFSITLLVFLLLYR